MCERRKIKNASSVLRHLASTWWKFLSSLDKPHIWNDMKIVMRETFVQPSLLIYSSDEVQQLDQSLAIPPTISNLLQDNIQKSEDYVIQNEVLPTSCKHLEPSHITPLKNKKGNAHDAKLIEVESSLDVLNFSTNHAMIEQILVEPSLDLPLSRDDLLVVLSDKADLHDDNYVMPMQPLKNNHTLCVLELNTCAENRHVIHNDSDVDELKLMFSLNTLGYIEFDVLCNLNYLEEKLYAYTDLPWLYRHTYHVFGKYNNKGQYMVQ